jgi:hypothetical protein
MGCSYFSDEGRRMSSRRCAAVDASNSQAISQLFIIPQFFVLAVHLLLWLFYQLLKNICDVNITASPVHHTKETLIRPRRGFAAISRRPV